MEVELEMEPWVAARRQPLGHGAFVGTSQPEPAETVVRTTHIGLRPKPANMGFPLHFDVHDVARNKLEMELRTEGRSQV